MIFSKIHLEYCHTITIHFRYKNQVCLTTVKRRVHSGQYCLLFSDLLKNNNLI